MTLDEARAAIVKTLQKVQDVSGLPCPILVGGDVPRRVLEQFDSTVWPVATSWIAKELGVTIDNDVHVFGGKNGGPIADNQPVGRSHLRTHRQAELRSGGRMSTEPEQRQLIAQRIREARQLAGLSQGQVAKLMGMHRPTVSEIEAGNRRVTADEITRFAEIFDVSTAYLLGEAPDRLAMDDPKLQLAARELAKLSPDALDGLLRALAAVRTDGDDESKG